MNLRPRKIFVGIVRLNKTGCVWLVRDRRDVLTSEILGRDRKQAIPRHCVGGRLAELDLAWEHDIHAALLVAIRDAVVQVILHAECLSLLRVIHRRVGVVLVAENLVGRHALADIRLVAHAPLEVQVFS